MITNTERTKLKKVLATKWISEVTDKLKENNVLNKKGNPYTKAFISHVFNGKNKHDFIENIILEVYQERKQKQSKMKVERKEKLAKIL